MNADTEKTWNPKLTPIQMQVFDPNVKEVVCMGSGETKRILDRMITFYAERYGVRHQKQQATT